MTFAEALNDDACSCGLEEGCTWFSDSNGNEISVVGEYRLLQNSRGVKVESDGDGFLVQAEKDGGVFTARFTSDLTWKDIKSKD